MDIKEQVIKDIAEQLNKDVSLISLDSELVKDLGADSLDVVEMLMTLEDQFGICIPAEEATGIKTVNDVIELINQNQK